MDSEHPSRVTPRITLTGFKVRQYRSFRQEADVNLAPITCIFGKNNMGKSALCRAPLLLVQPFRANAWRPFDLQSDGMNLGKNLNDLAYGASPRGFEADLRFKVEDELGVLSLRAGQDTEMQQRLYSFSLTLGGKVIMEVQDALWSEVSPELSKYARLSALGQAVCSMKGIREAPKRVYTYPGGLPDRPGVLGEWTPHMLAHAAAVGNQEILDRVSRWMEAISGVRIQIKPQGSDFSLDVTQVGRAAPLAVNLADTGEGIGQLLPLVVAICAHDQLPSPPALYVLEQPELHLHPFAHPHIAELLVESIQQPNAPRFLIETHSDTLLLRLRRKVAEEKLDPKLIQFYFVKSAPDGRGAEAKPMSLNDRGTTDWWPKGIFAEDLEEHQAIRRALLKREPAA